MQIGSTFIPKEILLDLFTKENGEKALSLLFDVTLAVVILGIAIMPHWCFKPQRKSVLEKDEEAEKIEVVEKDALDVLFTKEEIA